MRRLQAQRAQVLVLWCLLLLTVGERVRALPGLGRHRIWEEKLRSSTSRRLMTGELPELAAQQRKPPTFEDAPNCRALPNETNSQPDTQGRLWGWRAGASCAYKDKDDHVLLYISYYPGNWLLTPMCKAEPFPDTSVADSRFKVWGWEDGHLCAFKDDQQQPIPMDRQYNKLTWADAPACTESSEPTNFTAVPDRLGCLWGWQLDRNCAFKNPSTNEAKFYDGYRQICNATLVPGVTSAIDSSMASSEGQLTASAVGEQDETLAEGNVILPGMVTGVATQIGNKKLPSYYTPEEAQLLFGPPDFAAAEGGDEPKHGTQLSDFQPPFETTTLNTTSSVATLNVPLPKFDDEAPDSMASQGKLNNKTPSSGRHLLLGSQVKVPASAVDMTVDPCVAYGWSSRGLADVTPPGHASSGTTVCQPKTPEGDEKEREAALRFSMAENGAAVTRPPVDVPAAEQAAVADLPHTKGTGAISVILDATDGISIAEGAQLPREDMLGGLASYPSQGPTRVVKTGASQSSAVRAPKSTQGAEPPARRLTGVWHFPTIMSGATATAVSLGGVALSKSTSNSTGNATSVSHAAALATGNGTATSLSNADASAAKTGSATSVADSSAVATGGSDAYSGANSTTVAAPNTTLKCVVLANAINKTAELSCENTSAASAQFEADNHYLPGSWDKAPVCKNTPNTNNTVIDTMSRLWGLANNNNDLCAHRASNGSTVTYAGFAPLDWNTSAACSALPNSSNSMPDSSGRLWGWSASADNCAYKDADGMPNYYPAYFAEVDKDAASNTITTAEQMPGNSCVNCVNPSSAGGKPKVTAMLEAAESKVDTIGIVPEGVSTNDQPAVDTVTPLPGTTNSASNQKDNTRASLAKSSPSQSTTDNSATNDAGTLVSNSVSHALGSTSARSTNADPFSGARAARFMQLLRDVLVNKLGL